MSKEHTMTETEKLAKAALAVCDRWDTPDWSDHRHTADFIRDLREALTAWNTRPDEGEPVAWRWRKRGADVPWIVGSARIEGEGVDGFYEIQPLYSRPAPALDREGVARALRETVMPKSVRITQYAGHVYDFGSLPGITDEIVGLLADALTPELPEGPLHPRGFMPYWTKASDVEMAVYGLSYILQQIQATNTYKPNIGQAGAAMSSLEFAIRRLRDGASSRPPVTSDAVPGTNKETDQ
jgi:hypothetical protein